MVSVETERLIVRPIGVEDAEAFADLVGRSRLSVEGIWEKLAGIDELAVQRWLAFIGIFRSSDGVLMGHSVVSRSKDTEIADVDYWVREGFRGLGYMSEAAHGKGIAEEGRQRLLGGYDKLPVMDHLPTLDLVLTIAMGVLCAVMVFGNWIQKMVMKSMSKDELPRE